MKKILALLLATIMLVAMCCSCGGSEDDGTPTLKVYMPAGTQTDLDLVVAEANKIIEKKIGAKMEVQLIDTGAYNEKMNMIMASGEAYDICFTGYLNKYNNAVSKGGLMCLDDLLDEVPTLKKQIPQYLWDAVTFEGSIYAVPNEQINATLTAMFTFKDLAEKYNLDPESITKQEMIEPYLKAIKENEPDLIPYRANSGYFSISDDPDFSGWESLTTGFYVEKGDPKCKVFYVFDRPEYKAGAELRSQWVKKGYLRQDILSVGDDSMDFKNQKYAVWSATYKPGVEASFTEQFGGREVIAIKAFATPYIRQSNCTSTMLAIGRNSKHPEKAIKLIELLNTDKELYNLMSFGIEGKHYELTEDGKVRKIANSGYEMDAWKWGCQFNALLTEGMADDVWEETKRLNEEAEKSYLMNFVLDTTPITTELANFTAVYDEYSYVIEGLDPNYKKDEKAYRAKLEKVGIDKIIKELQKQVDAALKK